ncbi:MAG: tetratricopeptide repeat protein [Desulfuromonadales bacterium]
MIKRNVVISEIVVVLIMATVTYVTSGLAPFLSLDDVGILDGISSTELNYPGLFFGGGGDYYRPLTFVSFILDVNLFGYSAPAFHIVNLTFHTANALLVYYLTHLLISDEPTGNNRAPFIAALLFALHPVNTEAVMWIAARTDLLCCFFFLLALIVVFQRQNIFRSALAIFMFALMSLLAKESSVGLTGILLVWYVSHYREKHSRHMLWMTISAGCATMVYLFMRTGMHMKTDTGVGKILSSGAAKPLWSLIYDSAAALGYYISKALYPFPLNFAIVTINKPVSVAIFICSLAALLILFVRLRLMRLPLLIFTVLLVPPVLALHGKLPWTPYAERYLYLSMTGFAMVIGIAIGKLPYKTYLIAFALIALMSVPTMQRVALWGDPMKFWSDVMFKSPEFSRSYAGVACELLREKKYDEAEKLLNKALEMGLNKDYAWQNLAIARLGKGDLQGYESAMLKSAELSGKPTQLYIGLIRTVSGKVHDEAGRRRIIGYYVKAQERDPRYGDGLYNAAKEYLQLGETENALFYFRKFVNSPGDSMYKPFAERFIKKLDTHTPEIVH